MNERVRELRKSLGLTLEKFGERLGVTKVAISNIEKANRNVTEQMFKSICREFNVNEKWLRTGEGSMYIESDTFSLDEFLSRYNVDDLEIEFIKLYFELDESTRKDILNKFKKKFKKKSLADDIPDTSKELLEMYSSVENLHENKNIV
ncbi:MAG: helix-turn-helix transcriptional regulator [Lachnospiraceae bacterium]|nr:helix-turn-helix transcriptional regulator [Lachnospiraceae bacterium]